ncbi:MAG TPA: CotH kinase family protein [Phycisphaerales bacterium]|nr:CotH kinase family protein [Phycisphaerales bacterium]
MPPTHLRMLAPLAATLLTLIGTTATAQPEPPRDERPRPDQSPAPMRGRGGPGMGGPGGQERKLLARFDADKNGQLSREERRKAREYLKDNPQRRPGGGPGGPGGPLGNFGPGAREEAKPGERVSPADVKPVKSTALYDTSAVRTFFLEFDSDDWEQELADFYNTDVEVPATLTLDGRKYPGVGVSFRGASSFFAVQAGYKRSLNISVDFTDSKLRVHGKKTLNLLNAHADPSMMSTVLYSLIANEHIAAPRAAFARVVINGESWGVYVNTEQFDSVFVAERFESGKDAKGARWKVKGSPNGSSGLDYLGEEIEPYRAKYQIKSKDREEDWRALIELCRVLTETPLEELEDKLAPMLDIDGALWFLALDNALVNMDGYWVRASDYSIYRDSKGVFHLIPHDMNEAFSPGGGPGGRRGPGGGPGGPPPEQRPGDRDTPRPRDGHEPPREGNERRPQARGGVELDPLIGMDDLRKPLRSRLLRVPALRERYLEKVRSLADRSLNWDHLGPRVRELRTLIEPYVRAETRRETPFEAFDRATADTPPGEGQGRSRSLRAFAEKRRAFLLAYKPRDPESPPNEKGRD